MCRPINKRDGSNKNHGEVQRSRPPAPMEDGILIRIIHIEARRQKSRGYEKRGGNRSLQSKSAAVVSGFAHGPEQRERQADVEGGKEPRPKRYPRIPHVFGSANQ